jgi:error-prone DNA polymerase
MEALRARLYAGMAAKGITGDVADQIFDKLAAFADFGFPESHSVSFAYLVYASSWLKLHYPAAFCASLLNAQPMGFYSPNTLVADARRHGVVVLGPDVNRSEAKATLEPLPPFEHCAIDPRSGGSVAQKSGEVAVRLGLEYVRNVGDDLAARIAARRPYASMDDLVRRTGAPLPAVEALATAGAFGSLDLQRREALWGAGAVTQTGPEKLEGVVCGADAPTLPAMADIEVTAADLWATGVSPDRHPIEFARENLTAQGAVRVGDLDGITAGRRVLVGGLVTHRQRPSTAGGTIFLNLEDETGMLNVICSPGVWARYRRVARAAPALLVQGRLEREQKATNLVADRIEALSLSVTAGRSRDFR